MNKFLMRIWIVFGSFVIMVGVSILIIFVYIAKFLNKHFFSGNMRDPFHDSRQHPINDPNAPRG